MEIVPGTNALRLNKSLYGLRQSGFNWFTKFSKQLIALKFRQSTVDPCLFTYEHNGDLIRICIWVDDGLVSTNNIKLWHQIRDQIHKNTPLGSSGKLGWLLGMKIDYDRLNGVMRISQRAKIQALLERYGMLDCRPVSTPLDHRQKLVYSPPTTAAEEAAVVKAANNGGRSNRYKTYAHVVKAVREIIGSIGHLACWGRPDVRHSIYMLARYQERPTADTWQLLWRHLRYLKGTQDLTLTFGL
jgi:hypothetical protein